MSWILKKASCKAYIFLLVLTMVGRYSFAQINVTPSQTAQVLAEKLVGKGVTIKNITMNCPSVANGIFTASPNAVGIDSGIVLTTGLAATQVSAFGVNGPSSFLASTNNHAPGDPSLNALAGQSTFDACSLEFDVVPQGDTLKFDYIFSSEEYMNAVCGPYNDAFAFFISGPGITGTQNMALVPGTNIPVTINSVNIGTPGRGYTIANCNAMGPGSPFTAYYVDNSNGLYLTHKGRTTLLQAIHDVIPCNTYHLKMVIADAGNATYDSGVFLKAGSLATSSYAVTALPTTVPVPAIDSLPFAIRGCLPGHFRVSRSVADDQPQTIHYTFGGTAVRGFDFTVAADSVLIPAYDSTADVEVDALANGATGTKTVEMYIDLPFNCNTFSNVVDSAAMILYDNFTISILTPDTSVCTNVGFNLRVNGPDFLAYKWTPATGLSSANVKDPGVAVFTATTYSVSGSLPNTSCVSNSASITVSIHETPVVTINTKTKLCLYQPLLLQATISPSGGAYSYKWTGPDQFSSSLPDPQIPALKSVNSGTYNLYVTNDTNLCVGFDSVKVQVVVPDTPAVISPFMVCQNKEDVKLMAQGQSLTWYTSAADSTGSDTAPVVPTHVLGSYNYYVSQVSGGCKSEKSEIDVLVEKCCDGNIFIPDAFTPNNDGLNDKFDVRADFGYVIEHLQVYNRWGQIVFDGHDNTGWNGYFGGVVADVGSYFYYLKMSCMNGGEVERKGTVLLIK